MVSTLRRHQRCHFSKKHGPKYNITLARLIQHPIVGYWIRQHKSVYPDCTIVYTK